MSPSFGPPPDEQDVIPRGYDPHKEDKARQEAAARQPKPRASKERVERLFADAKAARCGADWVRRMREFYARNGYLTVKQATVLERTISDWIDPGDDDPIYMFMEPPH